MEQLSSIFPYHGENMVQDLYFPVCIFLFMTMTQSFRLVTQHRNTIQNDFKNIDKNILIVIIKMDIFSYSIFQLWKARPPNCVKLDPLVNLGRKND